MEYRTLGRTGQRISAISLGTEYLLDVPQTQADAVIHQAIDFGVNYFDLFWSQPHFRDIMGHAFAGRRSKVMLAAHLGAAFANNQYEKTRDVAISERFFEDFLERYKTDYVDVLFLHNIDAQGDYDTVYQPGGLRDLAERLRKQGKARFLGFSGHTADTALQAVASDTIDVLMFSIHLATHAVPGKRELLSACLAHNVGLIAMKPFAGGKLLSEVRQVDLETYQAGGPARRIEKKRVITPIQCLAYVLAQTGISAVVPGCKDVAELNSAMDYWKADPAQKDFSQLLDDFNQYAPGECVYCNHCLPCPSEINIGAVSRLVDQAEISRVSRLKAMDAYRALAPNAADCIECGDCEDRCPFGVSVIEKMRKAQERLS